MDTEMSDDIVMMVNDNLEWWWNITCACTTQEGCKLLFDLIPTVTGERIPLPQNLKNEQLLQGRRPGPALLPQYKCNSDI